MKRIYVFVKPNMDTFINPIVEYLRRFYDVHIYYGGTHQEFWNTINRGDLIWFEWADDWCQNATSGEKFGFKYLIRMHSYEIFTPIVARINWNQVDSLVVPNQSLFEVINKIKSFDIEAQKVAAKQQNREFNVRPDMIPPIFIPERVNVIPNPVDGKRFKFIERENKKTIGLLGQINFKKDPMLALYAFLEIVKYDPEFTLHIAGNFMEPRYRLKMEELVKDAGIVENVAFYQVHEDKLPQWLGDMNYVMSTSLFESFHYSIANGMATGAIPLISNWTGAENLYPKEYIWTSISDCIDIIKKTQGMNLIEQGRQCRKWVIDKFKKEDVFKEYKKLIDRLLWSDKFAEDINNGKDPAEVWQEIGLQHVNYQDVVAYCKVMGMIK